MSSQPRVNSSRNAPLALTHGEEHEFLTAYLWAGEGEDPDQETAGMPPLISIPKPHRPEDIEDERGYVYGVIHTKMKQTLRDHLIPVNDQEDDERPYVRFRSFDVVGDPTVFEYSEAYRWCGVELRTPANLDTLAAYDVSRYALNVLKHHYRLMVNRNCGLHCHIGLGSQSYDLSGLKRIAGFLWAADPLLSCLHPPERRTNSWCKSVRIASKFNEAGSQDIDHGRAYSRCLRYYGRDVRFGEYPAEWRLMNRTKADIMLFEKTREPAHHEPYQGIPPSYYEGILPPFLDESSSSGDSQSSTEDERSLTSTQHSGQDRVETPDTTLQLESASDSAHSPGPGPDVPDVSDVPYVRTRRIGRVGLPRSNDRAVQARLDGGALPGLMRIQACRSSCEIANGFLWTSNYNIAHYHCTNLHWRGAPLRTIEFREAAGTLDGVWAMLWSRICAGVIRFALQAPGARFHDVLMKCDHASRNPGEYDVVDLLDDMGMVAEAGLVEKRLEENMVEWGYALESSAP